MARDPTPDELIALVRRVEAAGFELFCFMDDSDEYSRKIKGYAEHLAISDAKDGRHVPERLALPIFEHSRAIRGYLRRIRSPFFPDPASDADHRLAMLSSLADDFRLRANGR